jgi:hypothetical protein
MCVTRCQHVTGEGGTWLGSSNVVFRLNWGAGELGSTRSLNCVASGRSFSLVACSQGWKMQRWIRGNICSRKFPEQSNKYYFYPLSNPLRPEVVCVHFADEKTEAPSHTGVSVVELELESNRVWLPNPCCWALYYVSLVRTLNPTCCMHRWERAVLGSWFLLVTA